MYIWWIPNKQKNVKFMRDGYCMSSTARGNSTSGASPCHMPLLGWYWHATHLLKFGSSNSSTCYTLMNETGAKWSATKGDWNTVEIQSPSTNCWRVYYLFFTSISIQSEVDLPLPSTKTSTWKRTKIGTSVRHRHFQVLDGSQNLWNGQGVPQPETFCYGPSEYQIFFFLSDLNKKSKWKTCTKKKGQPLFLPKTYWTSEL